MKNVFHLTLVPFVYVLVTKIQDGDTDIALNRLELVIPCKNKMEHAFPSKSFQRKTGLPFQSSSYFREFSSGMPNKSMIHLHPNRNFRNFLVNGKRLA